MTGIPDPRGAMWEIVFDLPQVTLVSAFEAALEDCVVGLSSFEVIGTPCWQITGYAETEPDRSMIEAKAALAAAAAGIEVPEIAIRPVIERDWVADVEKSLAPIHVGPYYVYGSHVADSAPPDTIAIRIDAGLAFGTGNHETTQGCLQAIETVCADNPPENPLDVGTGSGILAIALAKRFGIRVSASDNDPIAIDVARENASLNGVGAQVSFHVADGLDDANLRAGGPYDLVMANIVANPLIAMAADLAQTVSGRGTAVLSGILSDQADSVITAYEAQGLGLAGRVTLGEWETLTLRRSA